MENITDIDLVKNLDCKCRCHPRDVVEFALDNGALVSTNSMDTPLPWEYYSRVILEYKDYPLMDHLRLEKSVIPIIKPGVMFFERRDDGRTIPQGTIFKRKAGKTVISKTNVEGGVVSISKFKTMDHITPKLNRIRVCYKTGVGKKSGLVLNHIFSHGKQMCKCSCHWKRNYHRPMFTAAQMVKDIMNPPGAEDLSILRQEMLYMAEIVMVAHANSMQ
jgi:hypothetical protein